MWTVEYQTAFNTSVHIDTKKRHSFFFKLRKNMNPYTHELTFAKSLIIQAGSTIRQAYTLNQSIPEYKQENSADLVTETDKAVEEFIRDGLIKEFPEYKFVGEETGGESLNGVCWVNNFSRK